jgi:hypothetical protein
MPTLIAMVAIFIATALQPPMVRAGHTKPMTWTTPTEFFEADWCPAQNFNGAKAHDDFGKELVTNFLALANVAPAAEIRRLMRLLKPGTVRNILRAFHQQDTQGVRSATAAPAPQADIDALYGRLIKHGIIRVEDASAAPDGPVFKEWGEVFFKQFAGITSLGDIMKILEPIIATKKAELLAAAPDMTTFLDDTVLASDSDRRTHTPTALDRLRAPVFLRVAKRLWLKINLLRFFKEAVWHRAPVLYGRTGVESLFAPVNSELEHAGVTQFDHSEQLYQWIRDMLTVVEFTAYFGLCMDCLCR